MTSNEIPFIETVVRKKVKIFLQGTERVESLDFLLKVNLFGEIINCKALFENNPEKFEYITKSENYESYINSVRIYAKIFKFLIAFQWHDVINEKYLEQTVQLLREKVSALSGRDFNKLFGSIRDEWLKEFHLTLLKRNTDPTSELNVTLKILKELLLQPYVVSNSLRELEKAAPLSGGIREHTVLLESGQIVIALFNLFPSWENSFYSALKNYPSPHTNEFLIHRLTDDHISYEEKSHIASTIHPFKDSNLYDFLVSYYKQHWEKDDKLRSIILKLIGSYKTEEGKQLLLDGIENAGRHSAGTIYYDSFNYDNCHKLFFDKAFSLFHNSDNPTSLKSAFYIFNYIHEKHLPSSSDLLNAYLKMDTDGHISRMLAYIISTRNDREIIEQIEELVSEPTEINVFKSVQIIWELSLKECVYKVSTNYVNKLCQLLIFDDPDINNKTFDIIMEFKELITANQTNRLALLIVLEHKTKSYYNFAEIINEMTKTLGVSRRMKSIYKKIIEAKKVDVRPFVKGLENTQSINLESIVLNESQKQNKFIEIIVTKNITVNIEDKGKISQPFEYSIKVTPLGEIISCKCFFLDLPAPLQKLTLGNFYEKYITEAYYFLYAFKFLIPFQLHDFIKEDYLQETCNIIKKKESFLSHTDRDKLLDSIEDDWFKLFSENIIKIKQNRTIKLSMDLLGDVLIWKDVSHLHFSKLSYMRRDFSEEILKVVLNRDTGFEKSIYNTLKAYPSKNNNTLFINKLSTIDTSDNLSYTLVGSIHPFDGDNELYDFLLNYHELITKDWVKTKYYDSILSSLLEKLSNYKTSTIKELLFAYLTGTNAAHASIAFRELKESFNVPERELAIIILSVFHESNSKEKLMTTFSLFDAIYDDEIIPSPNDLLDTYFKASINVENDELTEHFVKLLLRGFERGIFVRVEIALESDNPLKVFKALSLILFFSTNYKKQTGYSISPVVFKRITDLLNSKEEYIISLVTSFLLSHKERVRENIENIQLTPLLINVLNRLKRQKEPLYRFKRHMQPIELINFIMANSSFDKSIVSTYFKIYKEANFPFVKELLLEGLSLSCSEKIRDDLIKNACNPNDQNHMRKVNFINDNFIIKK